MKCKDRVMMCMHIHPARDEAMVVEAFTNAFNPRELLVTGVASNLRKGKGLLASLTTSKQKNIHLCLEAGYLGRMPFSSTYARDEFSIFGGLQPLPPLPPFP